MKVTSVLLIAAAGMLTGTAAADRIYRWTDANGLTHFSSQPPPNGTYQLITPAPPPPTSAPGIDAIGKRSKEIDGERAGVRKARQDALLAKAEDAEKCAKARERVAYLDAHPAHRLFTVGKDGAESRMTDEQHDAEMAKARDVISNACN